MKPWESGNIGEEKQNFRQQYTPTHTNNANKTRALKNWLYIYIDDVTSYHEIDLLKF